MAQTKAVTESAEFQGLMRAVRDHGRTVLRDLSITLAQRAEGVAGMLDVEPLPEPPNPWASWGMSPSGEGGPA